MNFFERLSGDLRRGRADYFANLSVNSSLAQKAREADYLKRLSFNVMPSNDCNGSKQS